MTDRERDQMVLWCVTVGDGTSISGGVLGRCYVVAETEEEAIEKGKPHLRGKADWPSYRAGRIEVVE